MINEFKKILLAGLGAAAYTYEKSENLIKELIEKGKLSIEEGKELSEELKRNVKTKAQEIKPLTKDDFVSILKDLNLATKDEISQLNERISKLEEKNQ
ncbi:MAG: hypothetical protein Q8900_12920 [Bacillota bacterium]|nr:hypothetical protein [Bacillota bacterium]